jgi:BirA family biotin operon repressor/biotin-[acetyl-CoA-carboxylase] ligase
MFDVRHYERIGSTNDEARRLAGEGALHGTVVHADEQTAGRGRLARRWFSPPGNVYISLLLRYNLPSIRIAELSFLAALAVAETADRLLPKRTRTHLKWPNDVLVEGAKLSGILLEEVGGATILGIGVNVLHAPEGAAYATTTILASGGVATVDGTLTILLERLEAHLTRWEAEGFDPIRTAWLARAHPIGTPLRISLPNRHAEGAFAGLDSDGALLLDTQEGRQRILAGDVTSGAPPG